MEKVFKNIQLDQLTSCCNEIAQELLSKNMFIVYLEAAMGAGKTECVRHILYQLGLEPHIEVSSPTFGYMQEYYIKDRWYAHLDLYRCDSGFDMNRLGALDAKPYHGFFIEWPDKVDLANFDLDATHQLKIKVNADQSRDLIWEKLS